MNRKKFLRNSSLAGLFLTQIPLSNPTERSSSVSSSKSSISEMEDNFELNETTISILQEKMKSGALTSVQITNLYLKRIAAIDKSGPSLNSVIELNPDALMMAEAMDAERKHGKLRGPMHGIPVLIKDNINTGDQMMTTAGALAMEGNKAKKDAFIVSKLRASGAVLLGKTNLSEWANFRSNQSTSGWSSRGKQTKCPYVLDRNPSGSSAGTGSSIAANLATIGIGTETNGSIVSPSSINGLVGIKPTVGLWSRSGIIPISATQDTAGPMARTVTDAAILLGALTGVDTEDSVTLSSKGKYKNDYTPYLKKEGLAGKKIGIEKSHLQGNEFMVDLFKNAIAQMKSLGATIVEIDIFKSLNKMGGAEFTVLEYEFKDGVNKYLTLNPNKMKNLQDIIDFNKANKETAMPYFQQETLISSQAKGDLKEKAYVEALQKTLSSREILLNLMKINGLDAFSGITNGLACCIDLVNGDYDTGYSISTPAAISGFPHITLPMGYIHNLPVGLSFFAGPYEEDKIISMAYAYEQASQKREAPKFLSRVGF